MPKLDGNNTVIPVRQDTNYLYYDGLFFWSDPEVAEAGGRGVFYFKIYEGFLFTYKNVIVLLAEEEGHAGPFPNLVVSKKRIIIGLKSPNDGEGLVEIIGPALISTKNINCPPLSNGQTVKIFPTQR